MSDIKKMTSRLASGRIAFGLLSTCGVKGLSAALMSDFTVGLSNTANYLLWSSWITGILGVAVGTFWLSLLKEQDDELVNRG